MKSIAGIKHSIRAIKDTSQITSAMRLISTSKMQKALQKQRANSIYFNRVRSALKDILMHSHDLRHPYLEVSTEGKPTFVVIAADKGLCGGYNHDVLSFAQKLIDDAGDSYVVSIGQETRAHFEKTGTSIDVEYLHIAQNPSLFNARRLALELCDMYIQHDINAVYVVYTKFISSMKQQPKALKLLPLSLADFTDVEVESQYNGELSYSPSPEEVLNVLISQYLIGILYSALVQSYASENCARMMAMENASKNAADMIARLSIQMNRVRQQSITADLTEIVSAMDALSDD